MNSHLIDISQRFPSISTNFRDHMVQCHRYYPPPSPESWVIYAWLWVKPLFWEVMVKSISWYLWMSWLSGFGDEHNFMFSLEWFNFLLRYFYTHAYHLNIKNSSYLCLVKYIFIHWVLLYVVFKRQTYIWMD